MSNSTNVSLARSRQVWSQFLRVCKPYWQSDVKLKAFALLAILLLLLIAVNGLNVVINFVGGKFMTAFSSKDQPTFYKMLGMYFAVFVVGTPVVVLYSWVNEKLGLHWRTWLTEHMLGKYLANKAYYRLNGNTSIDNPDERIAQDVRDFTRSALSLALSVISSVVTLFSFTAILWSISHQLVNIVLWYSIAGTIATLWMGRRLVGLRFNQLKKEANFRYNLVHVRNNVESVAFYQGEEHESRRIKARFLEVVSNFNLLIGWQRNLGFLTTGYNYLVVLIPALVIAPLYFAGKVEFGVQAQADMAFAQILGALSLLITSIDEITTFVAQTERLGGFYDFLERPVSEDGATIISTTAGDLELNNVTVVTPDSERVLATNLSIAVPPGVDLLITGSSGVGKSSLLRTIGGLWNNGSGSMRRPPLNKMMFLPQRPYMTLGSLREQLLYPRVDALASDEQLQSVLEKVNLPDLVERVGGFDVELNWADILSLGEQQRLAFARLILSQPNYAILDESTSALDEANEKNIYDLLQSTGTTYISVGHRPSLQKYHARQIQLEGDGKWSLVAAPSSLQSIFEPDDKAALKSVEPTQSLANG